MRPRPWALRAVRPRWARLIGAPLLLGLAPGGCSGQVSTDNGACVLDARVDCAASFDGYACTGTQRPDEIISVDHVVQGLVCHPGGTQADGSEGFCCSTMVTDCAYDPRTVCPDGSFGYSCMGTNRPDSYDDTLTCGQGIRASGLLTFCCGAKVPGECVRNSNVSCTSGLLGFRCMGSGLPTEGDLGVDQSRSETPLLCSLPAPGISATSDYCCYAPAQAPPMSSCLQDQLLLQDERVAPNPGAFGCAGGAFGFACTGTDTPDQDYPPMSCTHPTLSGTSAEGYPATLYCCAFEP